MIERELLELIATQVGKLTTQFDGLTTQVNALTKDMAEIKPRLTSIENTVTRIENDHGEKLGALFDGYKLNSEKLDRIEKEVARHEEFILRRIR
ncbi:MAG: DNA replication initiation control protein YabA [Syntrophomonadaceae bacterium]|jgi:regulator of replication initiation timing|nr:DNA replication initiation control protein YabA [Syntrophomonadaceae bacterium]